MYAGFQSFLALGELGPKSRAAATSSPGPSAVEVGVGCEAGNPSSGDWGECYRSERECLCHEKCINCRNKT